MLYIFDFGIPLNNKLIDAAKIRNIIIEELKDIDAREISKGCGISHCDAQLSVSKYNENSYIQVFKRIVNKNNIPISDDIDVTNCAYYGFYEE